MFITANITSWVLSIHSYSNLISQYFSGLQMGVDLYITSDINMHQFTVNTNTCTPSFLKKVTVTVTTVNYYELMKCQRRQRTCKKHLHPFRNYCNESMKYHSQDALQTFSCVIINKEFVKFDEGFFSELGNSLNLLWILFWGDLDMTTPAPLHQHTALNFRLHSNPTFEW